MAGRPCPDGEADYGAITLEPIGAAIDAALSTWLGVVLAVATPSVDETPYSTRWVCECSRRGPGVRSALVGTPSRTSAMLSLRTGVLCSLMGRTPGFWSNF